MGSRCAWAMRTAPDTTIATTSQVSTRESRTNLFCPIVVPLSVASPGLWTSFLCGLQLDVEATDVELHRATRGSHRGRDWRTHRGAGARRPFRTGAGAGAR